MALKVLPLFPEPTWDWPDPERRGSTGRKPVIWVRRFLAFVLVTESCWEWLGYIDENDGYGSFEHHRAHRLMWRLIFGEIPEGLEVCHHCDNPPCVNPFHFFLGTQADNMEDMDLKGRRVVGYDPTIIGASGPNHWNYRHGRSVGRKTEIIGIGHWSKQSDAALIIERTKETKRLHGTT